MPGSAPPLSVLDLAPVPEGTPPSFAARRTVDLARLAERRGFVRYWFAEHHSMPSVASSAPEILIGHIASATERIRVGSGGIMLPNHAPLRVAEAFHTLAALHPGRIDLGIGRAPGSEAGSSRALRAFNGEQL
jgi:luciferase family oxidoreductase group 1